MGIDRFFQFFLPRESKFLPLLNGQVADIVEASALLVAFTSCQDHDRRQELYNAIKKLEQHCDTLTNQILDELNNTFITPFDREDIHTLASQLDDVLDMITGSAKRTILYRPRYMHPSAVQMAGFIQQSAESVRVAVMELDKVKRNPAVVKAECRKLHELENLADDVYENYVTLLFREEKDAIELLKQVEIIQFLENASDKAYRVSDTLKTIVVKYA